MNSDRDKRRGGHERLRHNVAPPLLGAVSTFMSRFFESAATKPGPTNPSGWQPAAGCQPAAHENAWLPALACGVWAAAAALAPDLRLKALVIAPPAAAALVLWTLAQPGRWLLLFLLAALLTPPLPFDLGNSGPHIAVVFAALGGFAGVLRARGWRFRPGPVNGPLIALAAVMLASAAPAAILSGADPALGSVARTALFGISAYAFFYTAYGPAPPFASIRWIYGAAVAAALFACVDFYFQLPAPAGFGAQFVWLDSGVYRRAQGLFYEASTLGNFCAFWLAMILAAFSIPRARRPVSSAALAAGGAAFFAALVLSYSRASLVNVAVAACVLALRRRGELRWKRLVVLLAVSVPAGALLVWKLFPSFAEMYWLRISASAEYMFTATNGVLSGRVASWSTLGGWLAANPFHALFGLGYKTLPYTRYAGGPMVADNMYLGLLVETGMAGLAALVWLNIAVLRAAARASRSADPRRSFLGVWMLSFWAGETVQMLSGDLLTYWRVLPLYFWILGLAVRE
jgi:hypothetical protein